MRVLIVEDDPKHANRFKAILSGMGAVCEVVRSVNDAMSIILRRRFDFVLLDLFLPDGNTISLSDYLRMRHPDTAILSITGSGAFANGDHVGVLSSDYILHKPVREADLSAIVAHLVRSNRSDCTSRIA
jgi:DNA-binding response OmpR family regulator